MTSKKIFLYTITSVLLFAFYYACNDSGVSVLSNEVTFSSSLKPLSPSEGTYEAFVSFPASASDHGDELFVSLGKFNVDAGGNPVDANGSPVTLKLKYNPSSINNAEDAIITIEPLNDQDTLPSTRLIGGGKVDGGTFISFSLTVSYADALGPLAGLMSSSAGAYLLYSPTTRVSANNYKGLWFTLDTLGSQASLTLPVIPDSIDWRYQAWVIDSRDSLNAVYDAGRFTDPGTGDDNQNCGGTFPGFTKPGHDWIQTNCPAGLPQITDLNQGFHRVMITIEPKNEDQSAFGKPFYVRLFNTVINAPAPGVSVNIPNTTAFPQAQIRISKE